MKLRRKIYWMIYDLVLPSRFNSIQVIDAVPVALT